jgi:transcription elongation GreA/GreB family factor
MPFRRDRFADVVNRQLDLFERDRGDLIAAAESALRAYHGADRDDAPAHYERYEDAVEEGQDDLLELRDAYAATLDEDTAEDYRDTFNRRVRKRFPDFGVELD